MPLNLMDMLTKTPKFLGKFNDNPANIESIDKRYLGKLPKKAIELMKWLLKLDPCERPSCADALAHPYFEGFEYVKQEVVKTKLVTKIQPSIEKGKKILIMVNSKPEGRKSPPKVSKEYHKSKIDPSTYLM